MIKNREALVKTVKLLKVSDSIASIISKKQNLKQQKVKVLSYLISVYSILILSAVINYIFTDDGRSLVRLFFNKALMFLIKLVVFHGTPYIKKNNICWITFACANIWHSFEREKLKDVEKTR